MLLADTFCLVDESPARTASGLNREGSNTAPRFDPLALLAPREHSTVAARDDSLKNEQTRATSQKRDHIVDPEDEMGTIKGPAEPGLSNMIEKLHGISTRKEYPSKRQRRDDEEDQDMESEVERSTYVGGGKGGPIGEYMKQKREEGAQEAQKSGKIVDLTNAREEEDVVVISDSRNQEVCYGRVSTLIQADVVPSPSASAKSLDDMFWPTIRVTLNRGSRKDHVIFAIDGVGTQFGRVAAAAAMGLAPIMDSPEAGVRLQARIGSRMKKKGEEAGSAVSAAYNTEINVYGKKRYGPSVGRFLSQKQITLLTPYQVDSGIETRNPHVVVPKEHFRLSSRGPMHVMRTVEEVKADVVNMFDSLRDSETLPEKEASSLIMTPLLKHQKQGLHFMYHREQVDESGEQENRASVWKPHVLNNGQMTYMNVITGKAEKAKPADIRGGILADMMGLGKTLSVLALMLSTTDQSLAWSQQVPSIAEEDDETELVCNSKATLLVSPLSTVANWEEQIKTHIKPDTVSYYIYHGPGRSNDLATLAAYDLVITTYNVASKEFSKASKGLGESPLQQINWFRVVLDEAHMIREQSTWQSKACCALSADRRWAVTGTPVQNRLDDLGALIKFLRIKPFDQKGGFSQYILTPFKQTDPSILPKLRLLVDSITLRRLKDRISLPARRDELVRLDFSEAERNLYELFAKDSSNEMRAVTNGSQKGLGGRTYARILQAILRLRLICAHGRELLSEGDLKILDGMTESSAIDVDEGDGKSEGLGLSREKAYQMLRLMQETNGDKCNLCDKQVGPSEENLEEDAPKKGDIMGHMTTCYQLLCTSCIGTYRNAMVSYQSHPKYAACPLCGMTIPVDILTLKGSEFDEAEQSLVGAAGNAKRQRKKMAEYKGPHTKTSVLIEFLMQSQRESESRPDERPIKSVVFSGWTSHLDLIEIALNNAGIRYTRLDGKMNRLSRTAALDKFRDDDSIPVILVSVAAGGLGLNLTTASKVYVMEPQFNPAAEAQAIDRVHRLGQTREVRTVRFIMRDSFEEKMLELQRKKQNLADLSMNRTKMDKQEATKRRLEELRSLFR
ncbi:MAG: hypothetical protein M1825_000582 [Sarcosagium campestre]|nr:MAG: hypothetical protein M1825_000582 [Sarcosagium campestre]